jgi:hypothetical protein
MAYRHPVLRRGHVAYIVVESVEKPTDGRSRSLLCLPHGRCGFSRNDQPGVAPRRTSTRQGAAATSTELSVSVLRAGTALSQQEPNPQQEVATRGYAKMSNLETYREKASTRTAVEVCSTPERVELLGLAGIYMVLADYVDARHEHGAASRPAPTPPNGT